MVKMIKTAASMLVDDPFPDRRTLHPAAIMRTLQIPRAADNVHCLVTYLLIRRR